MRTPVLTPVLAALLCVGALGTPAAAAPAAPSAGPSPSAAADEAAADTGAEDAGAEDAAAAAAEEESRERAERRAARAAERAAAVARAQAQVDGLRAEVERTSAELVTGTQRLADGQAELERVRTEAERVRTDADRAAAAARAAQDRLEVIVGEAYKRPRAEDLPWSLADGPRGVLDAALAAEDLERVQGNQQEALREAQAKSGEARELARRSADLEADAERRAADLAQQVTQLQEQALATRDRLQAAVRLLAEAQAAQSDGSAQDRARLAAARAALPPLPDPTGDGATCAGASTDGYPNGMLPESALCPLDVGGGHRLRADAAAAFNRLYAAGGPCVTDSYRTYAGQVDVFRRKPDLAAVPGTSNHGWGVAVDFGCGADSFDSPAYAWLKSNAGRFGFAHPLWAEPGGSRPEPWHWEYVGGGTPGSGTPSQ